MTKTFYDTNATLLPTVSDVIRRTQEDIADYFDHFLHLKPSFAVAPYSVSVNGFCGHGTYSGNYDFKVNDHGRQKLVKARFTYEYEYLAHPSGGQTAGWYIETHHSSAQPQQPAADIKAIPLAM